MNHPGGGPQINIQEREQYWPIFEPAGISRHEFTNMPNEEFEAFLNALQSSQEEIISDFPVDNVPQSSDINLYPPKTPEQILKEICKGETKIEIQEMINNGMELANCFIEEYSFAEKEIPF